MSDSPPSDADEPRSTTLRGRLERLWRTSWSALLKALAISIGLHLLLALPVVFQPSLPGDIDFEWEGRMADLEEIGHGASDFDDRDEPDFDEMADFQDELDEIDEDEEVDDGDQDDETDEDEEPAEPQEETQDDEETEPAETAEEVDEETIGPGPDEEDETDEETDEDDETDDEAAAEAEDETDLEELSGDELPGVETTGPSDLPDMRDYAPGNARVTSLVRTDRLRDTDFEPYVDDLIRAIPDYRVALDGTDFDPVADLDSLFMATGRPEVFQETFLAARHRYDDEQLKARLDNRFDEPISWETREGRPIRRLVPQSAPYPEPRRLLLAKPGLALIGQAEWFEELVGPVDDDSDLGRELAESDDAPSVSSLLEGLNHIERAAEDGETIMLVSAYGFRIPNLDMIGVSVSDLPSFVSAQLEVADARHPELTIDLQLRSESQARQFAERCPEIRDDLANSLQSGLLSMSRPLRQIGGIVEQLSCHQDGNYVVVEGDYRGGEVRDLLDNLPPFLKGFEPSGVSRLPDGPAGRDADDEKEDVPREDGEEEDVEEEDETMPGLEVPGETDD